jgi:hypothetical protein
MDTDPLARLSNQIEKLTARCEYLAGQLQQAKEMLLADYTIKTEEKLDEAYRKGEIGSPVVYYRTRLQLQRIHKLGAE